MAEELFRSYTLKQVSIRLDRSDRTIRYYAKKYNLGLQFRRNWVFTVADIEELKKIIPAYKYKGNKNPANKE